ncbi:MAG: Orotate phosphoribosyltransferase-like protein [Candidatus Methanohalarchaeum thermophilum]|uniref:Transcriptional regulator GfcR n=1 Tax=Methanohalarchaeum thermophilum TaxID=1903181 RepID=A0A1Q6DU05_METT1|nr:MAG: Orotate phosphoribosyltransferase-like protein [Candidatus Methanohalarchaeum thermophilum]
MSLNELVQKAKKLKEKGLRTGSIADELNVSKETAKWLISRSSKEETEKAPRDFFIEWDEVGSNSKRLKYISRAMLDSIKEITEDVEVIAGIAISGIPLAYPIAEELEAELSVILPRKHRWEPSKKMKNLEKGVVSPNFADPSGKRCVIVDDIITTGNTMRETVSSLNSAGAEPLAAVVLLDKKGMDTIDGVPVKSLLRVGRVDSR